MEDYLDTVYHDTTNPAAYAGINKLRDEARAAGYDASYGDVKKWAVKNEVYTMTKPLRRRFDRPHAPSPGLDYFWEADLVDFNTVSSDNDGYKYILIALDTFSRYAFARPLKTKTPRETATAFKTIVEDNGRRPRYSVRTDADTEFRGEFEKYLETLSVRHYIARSDIHAAYAERLIKTLRTRLYRAFLNAQKHRWVDILDNVVTAYNASTHRMTGYAPRAVTTDNEGLVAVRQADIRRKNEKKNPRKTPYRYKIGAVVRVGALRRTFGRQYDQKFSGELFKVAQRYRRGVKAVYKLNDWDGDPITGAFYEEELAAAAPPRDGRFKVDRVIKTRGRGRNKEAFVSWLYYPKKFNAWIPYERVEAL